MHREDFMKCGYAGREVEPEVRRRRKRINAVEQHRFAMHPGVGACPISMRCVCVFMFQTLLYAGPIDGGPEAVAVTHTPPGLPSSGPTAETVQECCRNGEKQRDDRWSGPAYCSGTHGLTHTLGPPHRPLLHGQDGRRFRWQPWRCRRRGRRD